MKRSREDQVVRVYDVAFEELGKNKRLEFDMTCVGDVGHDIAAWDMLSMYLSKNGSKRNMRKKWKLIMFREIPSCYGCQTEQPNQLAHMDPGGCLGPPLEPIDSYDSRTGLVKPIGNNWWTLEDF